MQPEPAKYLWDMLDAAGAIGQYTTGRTCDDYLADRSLRDAVNWNFCIIGEAMSQLKRVNPTLAEQITDHWKIIGLRNQLIHAYGIIDNRITWNIVETKLPVLIRELEQLLAK